MRTASAPVTIVCPDWCTVSAEEHAADLWDKGGICEHRTNDQTFTAEANTAAVPIQRAAEVGEYDPITVSLYAIARPSTGAETTRPTVFINEHVTTPAQALALADAIRNLVGTYRAEGGRA